VQVYKYHGIDLPQRRVDVLAEIADLLLGFWHAQKDVAESQALANEDGTEQHYDGTQESVEYKRNRLAHLAWFMQTQLKSVEISDVQAKKELLTYLQEIEGASPTEAKRWAKGFLRNSHDRSGILVEISPGMYSFIHKNFMEYFAATALIQQDEPIQFMLEALDEDPTWWDEMLCFAAAHPAGTALHKKWTPAILANAVQHERGTKLWTRRLTIAGMMARDMTNRLTHVQRVEVQKSLYQAATDGDLPAPTRANLADLLDDVGLLRELENDVHTFVPVAQDNILRYFGKYPVTNAQYARFLTPENFADNDLWTGFPKYAEPEKNYEKIGNWGNEGWDWLQKALRDEPLQEKQDIDIENGVVIPRYWRDARFGVMRPNAPVVGVSWYEANAYCKWLLTNWDELEEGKQGLAKPAEIRLPLESEWVFAVGGDANNRFAFGELKDTKDLPRYANTGESGIQRTTSVWMYPKGASQPHGLMDMSGNVWEWQANYGDNDHDVLSLRGGSWNDVQDYARVSYRLNTLPNTRLNRIGFRLYALPS
jgi:formylglycine-generating enzyme required for sulfatase activity